MPPWVGLFYITITIIPVAVVYGLVGIVMLYILKRSISIISILTFVGAGFGCGIAAMIIYLFAFWVFLGEPESQGALVGMLVAGGIAAISGSLVAVRLLERLTEYLRESSLSLD